MRHHVASWFLLAALTAACASTRSSGAGASSRPAAPDPGVEKQTVPADLPPLQQDAQGVRFDPRALELDTFDGAVAGDWVHLEAAICVEAGMRPVVVDVDHTAVEGDFLNQVRVIETARASLVGLDRDFGVVFLSANFARDRIVDFMPRHGYPDAAPIITRPRNYWASDYRRWCSDPFGFSLCEAQFKLDRIEYYRGRCGGGPARVVGLGDKFSDYYAYQRSGVCPLIVTSGKVRETNQREQAAGCTLDTNEDYAWRVEGPQRGDRCAQVPDRFIVDWSEVDGLVRAYLAGEVECGAWSSGAPGTKAASR